MATQIIDIHVIHNVTNIRFEFFKFSCPEIIITVTYKHPSTYSVSNESHVQ